MSLTVDTTRVDPRERFEFWTDAASRAFVPLTTRAVPGEPFWGRLDIRQLGVVQVASLTSSAHMVLRTRRHIAREDPAVVKVSLQTRGSAVISQDERTACLSTGDLTIYDSSRPYSLVSTASFEQVVFMFPRQLLRIPSDVIDRTTATRIPGDRGLGALVGGFLGQLIRGLGRDEALPGGAQLGDSVIDLVSALYDEPRAATATGAAATQMALLRQVKEYIALHLGEEDLTPDRIAAAHFISTRYLYKLFEAERVGVSEWVRHQRLERCRRDLRDPGLTDHTVARIAARWGFPSAAHFSRQFRAAYHSTPADYRLAG